MVGDNVKLGDRVVDAIGSVEYEAVALGEPHFVKLGDRVVYAIGSVEYEAIALGEPHFGLCGAIRGATLSLNLIYLNEQGTPVKIYAATLLSAAGDEAYLKSVAQEAAYRELDWKLADAEKRAEIVAEKLAQVKANPRTIGWRPDTNSVEVAQLKATIASLEQDFSILNEAFSGYVEAHPPVEDQPTPASESANGILTSTETQPVIAQGVRIVEMFCDDATARYELGSAPKNVLYGSLEGFLKDHPEAQNSPEYFPVKVLVYVLREAAQRVEEISDQICQTSAPNVTDSPSAALATTTAAGSSDSEEQKTVDNQQNQASAPSVIEKQVDATSAGGDVNATAGQEPDTTAAEGAISDGGSPTN
jgi:hypothetical protein